MKLIKPVTIDLSDDEITTLKQDYEQILRSGNLVLGDFTRRFEEAFARYLGRAHAVAMNSCTSALEALLAAHGAAGRSVAVPTNTNFATVAAILRSGGTPVFLDMNRETFSPDLARLVHAYQEAPRLSGVVWVHIGGVIVPDMKEVARYCQQHGLFLIEDAAHAHGSQLQGVKAGAFGDAAAFSFFATKVMTTMEGGMAVTDSEDVAMLLRSLRNQGQRGSTFGGLHYDLGSSWRLSEVAASMGLLQLGRLDSVVAARGRVVEALCKILDEAGLRYCRTSHMDQASHYKLVVRFAPPLDARVVKESFRERGIMLGGGVYEVPCHLQPVFRHLALPRGGLPEAEEHCPRHVCPPVSGSLTAEEQRRIGEAFAALPSSPLKKSS